MPETIKNMHLLLYGMAVLGTAGVLGMLTTHLSYRRMLKNTKDEKKGSKRKWPELWKIRDRLLMRMNRLVWYPSLLSIALLVTAVFLYSNGENAEGLPLLYLYLETGVLVSLLLFRQGLDFAFREEVLITSLKDYVEQAKGQMVRPQDTMEVEEDVHVVSPGALRGGSSDDPVEDALQKEAMIDHITESIRQTAAAGSHFRNMLTDEEEEIMREIIKEFMS